MAGVPSVIIKRAKNLLDKFTNEKKNIKSSIFKKQIVEEQLDLFNDNSELLSELKKINVEDLTPLEAINKLNELKKNYDK